MHRRRPFGEISLSVSRGSVGEFSGEEVGDTYHLGSTPSCCQGFLPFLLRPVFRPCFPCPLPGCSCKIDHAVFEDLIHCGDDFSRVFEQLYVRLLGRRVSQQVDDVEVEIGFASLAHGTQVGFVRQLFSRFGGGERPCPRSGGGSGSMLEAP